MKNQKLTQILCNLWLNPLIGPFISISLFLLEKSRNSNSSSSSLEEELRNSTDNFSFTQAPIMGGLIFDLDLDLGELYTAIDATAEFNKVCLGLDLNLDFNLLNLVNSFKSNFTNLFSIGEYFKSLYSFWYMALCSLFPGSIPPLPGKTPWSFPLLLLYLVYIFLLSNLVLSSIKLIIDIYRLFCYRIMLIFPNLTKKLLLLLIFDKPYNLLMISYINLRKTDKNKKKRLEDLEYIRLNLIFLTIGRVVQQVIYIIINGGLIYFILSHGSLL